MASRRQHHSGWKADARRLLGRRAIVYSVLTRRVARKLSGQSPPTAVMASRRQHHSGWKADARRLLGRRAIVYSELTRRIELRAPQLGTASNSRRRQNLLGYDHDE